MHLADDHSRWNEDLAAYAIGALDAHEMAAFARHLAECDSCRAELHRLAPAVELLPGSVEQLQPPPALRGRIMAEVEADLAGAGAVARARSAAGAPQRRRAPLRWPSWRPALALAGTAAVAAAFAIGVIVSGEENGGGTGETVPIQALVPARAAEIRGSLIHDGGDWRLDVDQLPELGRDRVYQAWVMRGRAVEPSTVFVLARDGTASVAIPRELREGDRVLVTSEPRGGSAAPTTRPLLSASA